MACQSTTFEILKRGDNNKGGRLKEEEKKIPGGFKWTRNSTVLHSDVSVLPRSEQVQCAWNYVTRSEVPSVKGPRRTNRDKFALFVPVEGVRRDSFLTLKEIIKLDLPNADFAFLSACQTTIGDDELSDEAVHITGGMLLAGYKGVVATMWSIQDDLAPEKHHLFEEPRDLESLSNVHLAPWHVNLTPSPKIAFTTILSFTDLLKFQLSAELIGAVKYDTLTDADLAFDGLLEQHILQYIHDQIILQFDRARQAAQEGLDAAQAKVDEAQQAVDEGIAKAQADIDAAFAAWGTKRTAVTAESQRVIDSYNANITRLQRDIDNAQRHYDQAMESARQSVASAQNDRARALADGQHEVDNAERKMVADIAAAQRAVNGAKADMNRRFGSAQSEVWKHGETAGLEAAKAVVLASKAYLGAQAALSTARGSLWAAERSGSISLQQSKNSLAAADLASQTALDASIATMNTFQSGSQFVALQGAKQALELYKQVNTAAYQVALTAIDGLMQSAEYLAYGAASGALVVAKGATTSLDAAKSALEVVREAESAALRVGEWVFSHLTKVFDIQVVRLSGSLRGTIGEDGKLSKPLTAHVEGLISGNHFTLDGEFDPRRTAGLITTILKRIWSEVESIAGVIVA
ncbi:hypothetical protein CPB86DRAFT_819960 [Serendipita vermifera]|nr:hypothetical protein CPB86DRAFT_819960 [Serendipita vermifera]